MPVISAGPRPLHRATRPGVLILAVIGLALAICACQQAATLVPSPQAAISVGDILADPERFFGQAVEAAATVDRTVSGRIIVLQSQSPDREMLAVLGNQTMQALGTIEPGQMVRLVGVVQPLNRQQIKAAEQQLGVTLDEDQLLNLSNETPFLIVQNASK